MKNYHKNPRTLTERQYKDLDKWMRELGDLSGVVHDLNSDEVINGNQRSRVMDVNDCEIDIVKEWESPDECGTVALGYIIWKGSRFNYRAVRWNDEQCEKANIIANKAGGTWDFDALANNFEVDDLLDWGFEPFELGIEDVIDDTDAEPQIDRAEELREKWGVELGQLWQLGEHRLICGDCTDEAVVGRVMAGENADLLFTDPPYNVAYQANEGIDSLKARNRRTDGLTVSNDSMSDDQFDAFLDAFLDALPLDRGAAFYLCAPAGRTETQFRNALHRVSGLTLRQCIVWVKDRFVFGRQDYHWRHESILYGWRDGAAHYFVDDHTQDTVWDIERPIESKGHPTMKPIALPEKAIKNSSRRGDSVLDPFLGSGTTLIACENLGRKCRGVEIEPKYVAVTLQRYYDAFGIGPVLINED